MLTDEQRRAFRNDGFITIPGVVDGQALDAMERRMWAQMSRHGIQRDDPLTWPRGAANGLQRVRRNDPSPVSSTSLREAFDELMTEDWITSDHWGTALVTFRNVECWNVPHRIWHLDYPYSSALDEVHGMNVFLFVTDTEPGGGGTLAVRSSPRLVGRFVASLERTDLPMKVMRGRFDRSHTWLRALSDPSDGDGRRERFMASDTDIDGIPARVVELVGRAGDVVLCHPLLVHSPGPNAMDRPRMMRVTRVWARRPVRS